MLMNYLSLIMYSWKFDFTYHGIFLTAKQLLSNDQITNSFFAAPTNNFLLRELKISFHKKIMLKVYQLSVIKEFKSTHKGYGNAYK